MRLGWKIIPPSRVGDGSLQSKFEYGEPPHKSLIVANLDEPTEIGLCWENVIIKLRGRPPDRFAVQCSKALRALWLCYAYDFILPSVISSDEQLNAWSAIKPTDVKKELDHFRGAPKYWILVYFRSHRKQACLPLISRDPLNTLTSSGLMWVGMGVGAVGRQTTEENVSIIRTPRFHIYLVRTSL